MIPGSFLAASIFGQRRVIVVCISLLSTQSSERIRSTILGSDKICTCYKKKSTKLKYKLNKKLKQTLKKSIKDIFP